MGKTKKRQTGVGGVCTSSTTNDQSTAIEVENDESIFSPQKDYNMSDNYHDNTMNGNKQNV